jgi:hypothetical protein
MNFPELHVMRAELIEERATMRYSCPLCDRCVEDGPDGLVVVHRGDAAASHRGGSLVGVEQEVGPIGATASATRRTLH